MRVRSKPYLDILSELGYYVVSEDIETTYSEDLDYDEDDLYILYYAEYSNGSFSKIQMEFISDDPHKVRCYLVSNDLTYLDIKSFEVGYFNDGEDGDGDHNFDPPIRFYSTGTAREENEIFEISRVTPELFRKILVDIKSDSMTEVQYYHKFLQRYLYCYYNIIDKIVNPIAKLKNLYYKSSIQRYDTYIDFECYNNNIEIYYYDRGFSKMFTVGIDYITEKLYFYVDSNYIIFDFETVVTTKGRFLELLKEHDI